MTPNDPVKSAPPVDYDEAMTFDWSSVAQPYTVHRISAHAYLCEERVQGDPFHKPYRIKRKPDNKILGVFSNKPDALEA